MCENFRVRPLANDYTIVRETCDPLHNSVGESSIVVLPNGELLVTSEMSGLNNTLMSDPEKQNYTGVYLSKDKGSTWEKQQDIPFCSAKIFSASNSVYVMGIAIKDNRPENEQTYVRAISRSEDFGRTWSKPAILDDGCWHGATNGVWYANGNVYLVMEKRKYFDDNDPWYISSLQPILMRGSVKKDLTRRDSWTFAQAPAFRDVVDTQALDDFGMPFYAPRPDQNPLCWSIVPKNFMMPRWANALGWLETNVVQILDPTHEWYDPSGHTFHLFMRAESHRTNMACVMQVKEHPDGSMTTETIKAPSGKNMIYIPFPGGHLLFNMVYDIATRLYWLVSTQSTDSMCKPEYLAPDRYHYASDERDRLMLSFSKNCIDWCFAGMVAIGTTPMDSRHYAVLAIDGDDLYVVSRSGNVYCKNAHDCAMTTFHKIKNFRGLVY